MTTDDIVQKIKELIDLEAYVSRDTQLRAKGSTCVGLSPFRKETNPSFTVWPTQQSWYDFGLQKGGDIYEYIRTRDGCGFREALEVAASYAGVSLPQATVATWVARLDVSRGVADAMNIAVEYYHSRLDPEIRWWVRQQYGFSDQTISRAKIGWSPGDLWDHLMSRGVSEDAALGTGMFLGKGRDFYVGRIIFPYFRGKDAVYAIGRQTPHTPDKPWEKGKYKKLLTKTDDRPFVEVENNHLFGLNSIVRGELCLLTEGVTDAISAHQAGIPCVSPVTTQFRAKDVPMLVKALQKCERVVVCNDSETNHAGEDGAVKTATLLKKSGIDARIAVLPLARGQDKVDVNSYLLTNTAQSLMALLDAAPSIIDYLIDLIPPGLTPAEKGARVAQIGELCDGTGTVERDAYMERLSKATGVKKATIKKATKKRVDRRTEKTSIVINYRQMSDIIVETRSASEKANDERIESLDIREIPILCRKGGNVCKLSFATGTVPEIVPADLGLIYGAMVRDVDWMTSTEDGMMPATPPHDVARDLLSFPPAYPEVETVITTPVYGQDRGILATRGLHAADRTWLELSPELATLAIPTSPTRGEVSEAICTLLNEVFVDFPFVGEADLAHILAALILPFCRRMIDGPTPLHVVESPAIGSGKSLLCNLVSVICTGETSDVSVVPTVEEEVRKSLTSELIKGKPIVVLDNVAERKTLDSPAIASMLTSSTWKDRVLGRSEMAVLPNRALWFLTGNNPLISPEITRRSIRVRIDPKCERAWERTEFRHKDIIGWAKAHRPRLVGCVLTLVSQWVASGGQTSADRLGSFEAWSGVVGGILGSCGITGFLGNLVDLYADADQETEMWVEFTSYWYERFGNQPQFVSTLNELCEQKNLMVSVRGDGLMRSQETKLGKALTSSRDRIYGGYRVESGYDAHAKRKTYRIVLQKI